MTLVLWHQQERVCCESNSILELVLPLGLRGRRVSLLKPACEGCCFNTPHFFADVLSKRMKPTSIFMNHPRVFCALLMEKLLKVQGGKLKQEKGAAGDSCPLWDAIPNGFVGKLLHTRGLT